MVSCGRVDGVPPHSHPVAGWQYGQNAPLGQVDRCLALKAELDELLSLCCGYLRRDVGFDLRKIGLEVVVSVAQEDQPPAPAWSTLRRSAWSWRAVGQRPPTVRFRVVGCSWGDYRSTLRRGPTLSWWLVRQRRVWATACGFLEPKTSYHGREISTSPPPPAGEATKKYKSLIYKDVISHYRHQPRTGYDRAINLSGKTINSIGDRQSSFMA